tara:strand:- start:328 stop:1251 length:924 start_codon:yes stop_codon:yes gene_type:complete
MIKVIHVYRVFSPKYEDPIVSTQIRDLSKNKNIIIKHIKISKSKIGYLLAGMKIFFLNLYKFDLIHFHHGYCGFLAIFSFKTKKICSLMGSEILEDKGLIKKVTNFYIKSIWDGIIVKSKEMKNIVKSATIMPNGVDFNVFKPIGKKNAIKKVGFNTKYFNIIIVVANIDDKVKNLKLAKSVIEKMDSNRFKLHILSNIEQTNLIYYYNAADILLLTSLSEGSPNVIKEALACNCPVISTDVGDVKDLIKDVHNSYIVDAIDLDIIEKINEIYQSSKNSNGRSRIKHLDINITSKKMYNYYHEVMKK